MSSKKLESEQLKPLVNNEDSGTSSTSTDPSSGLLGTSNRKPQIVSSCDPRLIRSTENLMTTTSTGTDTSSNSNRLQLPLLTITHANSSDQVYPKQNQEKQDRLVSSHRHDDRHNFQHHSGNHLEVSDNSTPRRFNFGLRRFSHSHTV